MPYNALISVIIINYNGMPYIEKLLKSILNNTYKNIEIIFVDNSSTDGSLEFVTQNFSGNKMLKIIPNSSNIGPSLARNLGAKIARGEYLIFIDSDTYLDNQCIARLYQRISGDRGIGACAPKVVNIYDNKKIYSIGGTIDYLGFPVPTSKPNQRIFIAPTTCICIRRETFKEVGGFDSSYFIYYEDNDLCWRINLRGYKIVTVPDAIVYHADGALAKNIPATHGVYNSTRNALITIIKNYELTNVLKFVPLHILMRMLEICAHIMHKQIDLALGKAKALLSILLDLKYIYISRKRVQGYIRRIPDRSLFPLFKPPNFVYYYKRFSDLYLKF